MGKLSKSLLGLLVAAAWLAPAGSHALFENDPLIDGAKQCTQYLPRHEREKGIPMHLLAAIASTESGRYHQGLGLRLPWPWTINAEGQGYFFQTKEEAIAAVQRLQAKGVKSIDVGCMQVNLMHHPRAFSDLQQAFDPAYNIAYAAGFLHDNFAELKSWRSATAAYHSRTAAYGSPYVAQVFDTWNNIITKVAEAKSGTLALMRSKWDLPKFSRVTDVDAQLPKINVASSTAGGRIARSAPRMHSVTVGSRTTRENGVLVIRPGSGTVSGTEMAMSEDQPVINAKPAAAPAPEQFNPRAKIVRTGAGSVRMGSGTTISVSKGPQFIFDN